VDTAEVTSRTVEAVWRIESARLVAGLARLTQDVGLAEEYAQDALVTALEQWPRTGVPANPAGWLMTTAKNRAIDAARRRATHDTKLATLHRESEVREQAGEAELDDAIDDHVGDDLLRLVFTACHPTLTLTSRVALTLRCLGGLSTAEIARALLDAEPAVAQRMVRAKRTLRDRRVAFDLPPAAEWEQRLSAVLEVVYLIFNEGYAATSGDDWTRPALCEEAMRLGRVLAGLLPEQPEVHGLVALMELQAARLPARIAPDGRPVLLADQDRRRWDRLLLRRGLAALERAESLEAPVGPYTLQAAIAACHARATTAADTAWQRIADLYTVLAHVWPNPVVELNRAVAVGFAEGPAAGLALLDALDVAALDGYPQLPAVRGDLLERLGRAEEAAAAFRCAAALTRNERERALYEERASSLQSPQPRSDDGSISRDGRDQPRTLVRGPAAL
jgi:RNA polymerase sigma factor (sigma-70 family)